MLTLVIPLKEGIMGEKNFFSFFLNTSIVVTYIFIVLICTIIIIVLEPYALNAKFHHFIPRFNKISLK